MTYTSAMLKIDAGSYLDIRERMIKNDYAVPAEAKGAISMTGLKIVPELPSSNPFAALLRYAESHNFVFSPSFVSEMHDLATEFDTRRDYLTLDKEA